MNPDIKAYRLAKGWSQGQMAGRLNVAKSTISMVESHERKLPPEALLIFESLLADEPALTRELTAATDNALSFKLVKELNINHGKSKLLEYRKECEFELHKNQRKLHKWQLQYEKAMSHLLQAEVSIAQMAGKKETELQPGFSSRQQSAMVRAYNILLKIGGQQPMLLIVKIQGLQRELAVIQEMLDKPADETVEGDTWWSFEGDKGG